jgi:hypothetical protein
MIHQLISPERENESLNGLLSKSLEGSLTMLLGSKSPERHSQGCGRWQIVAVQMEPTAQCLEDLCLTAPMYSVLPFCTMSLSCKG